MSTVEHVTLDELENLMRDLNLPTETRMTVIFENEDISPDLLKRQKALKALAKLKGSGTGRLVAALLQERAKDKFL